MNLLACDGQVTVTAGVPQCSGAWMLVHAPEPFDPLQLDPLIVASSFGAGLTLVATSLLLGLGCKLILDFIRKG
ncbi:TPA: hypothetical protein ACLNNW_003632 [Vibrio cholerae O1]